MARLRKLKVMCIKATDNVFYRVKGFLRFPLAVGAYRVSLSGFFDVMGGNDDRPAMVGTQTDQVVPDAADIGKKKKQTNKKTNNKLNEDEIK